MKLWVLLPLLIVCGCDQLFGFTQVPLHDGGADATGSGSGDAAPPSGWLSLEPGSDHTCGLDTNGRLLCFAAGSFMPKPFDPMHLTWKQVSTGDNHSCAVDANGDLFCWGGNAYGELDGTGLNGTPHAAPTQVALNHVWKSVAAGAFHTCALTVDGAVYCWGNSQQTGGSGSTGVHPMVGSFTALSAGVDHTCALDALGDVLCWGADGSIQSSGGSGVCTNGCAPVLQPQRVGTFTGATAVSAGGFATCAIVSGNVTCWGSNERIDPTQSGNATPAVIQVGGQWTAIAVGDEAICGIDAGRLKCWGTERAGGLGGTAPTLIPPTAPVDFGPADHISLTRARDDSEAACAISNGAASCWGPEVPTPIPDPSGV